MSTSTTSKGAAIVTGAAQGIGKAIALRLAVDGYDIAINDIPAQLPKLEALSTEIQALGRKTTIVPADVAEEAAVEKMVNDVASALGGVDVMVSNAGICQVAPLVLTTAEHWDKHQDVNLRGTFLCFKHAALHMIKQGRGGRLIGGASLAAFSGIAMHSAYSASKAGIRALTHSAARELGKDGITVNSYAPGVIITELTLGTYGAEFLEGQKASAAINDNGTPEDIAGVVSFLVSKDARFISGQTIMVDGGRLCV